MRIPFKAWYFHSIVDENKVRERLSEWWDRASKPTPISVRVNTFKLLKRNRARFSHVIKGEMNDTRVLRGKLPLGTETELVGRPILRSPGHLPASRQN